LRAHGAAAHHQALFAGWKTGGIVEDLLPIVASSRIYGTIDANCGLKDERDEETIEDVGNNRRIKLSRRISVAPMMDWTDGL
jgi:hypothetical protein